MMALSPQAEVIISVIAYSLCSGSLVLVNKLILHYLPFPSLVIVIQLLSSIFLIYGANFFGVMTIDSMKWEYFKPYMVYTVAFSTGVYTNMMCLNNANVETVIVARAMSPLVVSFLDPIFLGRELPSRRSLAALSMIVVGAFGYASTDEQFKTQGWSAYFWPTLYLGIITFEMVYGKQIVRSVKFQTVSGPVQYTNLLGWPPMIMFAKMGGEFERFDDMMRAYGANSTYELIRKLPSESIAFVVIGCLVGTGIGYTGWWCRGKISATSYTLVGVLNKCLTVLVNALIWDNHATPSGIASLLICLVGGSFYKQAPLRKDMEDDDVDESKPDQKDLEMNVKPKKSLIRRSSEIVDEELKKPLIRQTGN